MGAQGSGLYANDTTCDVRDSYMQYLQNDFSNEEVRGEITVSMYDCTSL